MATKKKRAKAKTKAKKKPVPIESGVVPRTDLPVQLAEDIPPPPSLPNVDQSVVEREQARRERQERKAQEEREREERRKAANEISGVASLEQARKAREVQAPPPVSGPSLPPKQQSNSQPITLPLSEFQKYKLQAKKAEFDRLANAIREPLKARAQARLDQEIAAALNNDPICLKAQYEQIQAVNEILDAMAPQLPPGYAVTRVEPENDRVVCELRPDQAGKKLPLPVVPPPKGA